MIINKIDLLGTSDFNPEKVKNNARSINPTLQIFELSCATGEGLENWYAWLIDRVESKKGKRSGRKG